MHAVRLAVCAPVGARSAAASAPPRRFGRGQPRRSLAGQHRPRRLQHAMPLKALSDSDAEDDDGDYEAQAQQRQQQQQQASAGEEQEAESATAASTTAEAAQRSAPAARASAPRRAVAAALQPASQPDMGQAWRMGLGGAVALAALAGLGLLGHRLSRSKAVTEAVAGVQQTMQSRGLAREAQQRLNEFMSTLRNMQVRLQGRCPS